MKSQPNQTVTKNRKPNSRGYGMMTNLFQQNNEIQLHVYNETKYSNTIPYCARENNGDVK